MATNRFRSTDLRVPRRVLANAYYPNTAPNWGAQYLSNAPRGNTILMGYESSIRDENHPGYAKRIARGHIIMGDLVRQKNEYFSGSDATLQVGPFLDWGEVRYSGPIGAEVDTRVPWDTTFAPNDLARMKQVVLVKCYSKMNATPLLSGEFLSDFGETLNMLRHPLRKSRTLLTKMYQYRAKHLGKTTSSAMKASANAWLEYRYGWRPLLFDCEEVVKQVHKKREQATRRLVARASESSSSSGTKGFTVSSVLNDKNIVGVGSTVTKKSVTVCGGVLYEVRPRTNSQHLMHTLGVLPSNVPETLWAIVPYSFVVDWFVNVSDWLKAVTPHPDITVLGNWVTDKSDTQRILTGVVTYKKPSPLGHDCSAPVSCTSTFSAVNRLCMQPLPSFPPASINLTYARTADALSLLCNPILGSLKGLRHQA